MYWPGVSSTTFGSPDVPDGATDFRQDSKFVGVFLDRRDAVAVRRDRASTRIITSRFSSMWRHRGRARIVFEDVKIIVIDADDVDAGDMHPDVVRA